MKLQQIGLSLLAVVATWSPLGNAADAEITAVEATLKKMMPRGTADSIGESTIPGLYEAVYGAQVIYVSRDGHYMLEGDIFDVDKRINVTEGKRQGGRVKAIESIDADSMIMFAPDKDKPKYVVTAFTDIDCGYCRKLHKEMAEYNKLGIAIRYAAFPRSGLNSESYYKAESVWCAKDRNKAMNFAKNGATLEQLKGLEQVNAKQCGDAIKKQYQVGRDVGVTGTPTLVMGDGQVLPGYVPADKLLGILKN